MKWRGGELEKPPQWLRLYHGYCSPPERWTHGKKRKGRGWGMRQQRGKRRAWRQSGIWEVYVMTWKSQPVGHARLRGGLEWQDGLGARLPPTWCWLEPEYKQWTCHWLQLVNKPNIVGKTRCEAEDAAVSMLCLPSASQTFPSTPNFFLLCQREINTVVTQMDSIWYRFFSQLNWMIGLNSGSVTE